MIHVVCSASEVLFFMASLYGWGSLVNRWACGTKASGLAYPTALGVATLIAVGSVLNVVNIATPPVLLTLLVAGLGLALFFAYRSLQASRKGHKATGQIPPLPAWNTFGSLVYLAFLLVVFFFLVLVLMPSRSFNFADDFHIYLMWPLRMLQTGSLGGNPFDHIGLSSLGAQSFMHGMFLSFGDIADINAFDAILCLLLALVLLKELGEKLGVRIVFIMAAGLAALLINPQYVNVSSLYSGTLMLLGLTYATMLLNDTLDAPDSSAAIRAAVPCSLFFAALLSLKTTYVFLVPLFWAASLAGSLLLVRERRRVLLIHGASAVFSLTFMLSWLVIHLDRYLQKIHYLLDGIHYPRGREFSGSLYIKRDILPELLSKQELFWGNSYRDFLYVSAMLLLALAMTGWIAWRQRSKRETGVLLLPSLVLVFSVVGNYFFYYGLTFFRADLVVRYSIPMLIGAAPVAVLLAGRLCGEGYRRREKAGSYRLPLVLGGLLLSIQIAVVGLFGATFLDRVKRVYNFNTLLSFPYALSPRNMDYNRYVLGEEARKRMDFIQRLVPVGEPFLAWVSMPLHLDYSRNPVYATSEYGLSNNLLVMPLTEGTRGMRRYFQEQGIRYFIWEYQGVGMKPEAQLGGLQRKFLDFLYDVLPMSRILYNDGGIIAFDIGPAGS